MAQLTKHNIKENMIIIETYHPEYGTWRVLRKYDEGIWEVRGESGEKVLFESELHFYHIIKF